MHKAALYVFTTLIAQIAAIFMVSVCGFALWKGERAERLCASAVLLCWLFQILVFNRLTSDFDQTYLALSVDLGLMVFFSFIAVAFDRWWAVSAMLMQGIGVVAHVAWLWQDLITIHAYFAVLTFTGPAVLVSLAVGTFNAWREARALSPGPLLPPRSLPEFN